MHEEHCALIITLGNLQLNSVLNRLEPQTGASHLFPRKKHSLLETTFL